MRVNRTHNRVLTMLLFNRKAYTLSQFILLWILGVLFVILVCLNVFRYRATAQARQAEAFMQEVRAEQEDRCTLGRKYAVYQNHLKTFYKRKEGTRHIRYDLSSGHGITAHHKLLDYRLQMPSYTDGRICCDNCGKLNHYYSRCDVLQKRKDFIPSDPECTVYRPEKKGKKTDTQTPAQPAEQTQEPTVQPTEKMMTEGASVPPVPATEPQETPAPTEPASDAQTQLTEQTPATEEKPATTQPAKEATAAPADTPVSADAPAAGADDSSATAQPAPKPAASRKCKIPASGEFFIDECDVYQSGARGSVVHTWNFDTCSYEITQSCMMPARWKKVSNTKEEKGLYPSDLDTYCEQLIKSAPCPANAAANRECGTVDEVCYKECKITQQTEVRESALIVLYDVEVKSEQLRCLPAKEITVSVP